MNASKSLRVSETAENMAGEILRNAKEQRDEIIREAEKKAEEIMIKARKEAEERKRKLVEQGKRDLERFKEQELIKMRIEFRKKLYEYAWSMISSLMSDAAAALEKVRVEQKEVYRGFLSRSLAEIFGLINGGEMVIHVDKRDERIVKELLKSLSGDWKVRVVPDLTTVGGLVAISKKGFQEVDDRIETRLRLKSKVIREKLYSFLFGDLNVGDW
ncbi:MAG: V-type ATP synthase subunit E [Thermoproteota archaeon]